MFENPILNELYQKYREKRLAHAYLVETNNLEKAMKDIKLLIQKINCPEEYTEKCNSCNLCHLISKDNLPSLKIIEPDGVNIKKNQIEELKEKFATIPVYSKYNTYIIKQAEKLNGSSANSMLKFVEEPTEGILGFFLTNNKDVMIDTIKSRCQSIVLNYETDSMLERLNITAEEYSQYIGLIEKYLSKIKSKELINHKKEILNVISERREIENLFKIILDIYHQHFLKKIGMPYNKEVTSIVEIKEEENKIIKEMNIISKITQSLNYNVNIELVLDEFVIEMRGYNE